MFRKIMREIAIFLGFIGLLFYLLIWFLFDFLIEVFMGTKITRLIFLIQKGLEKYTNIAVTKIVESLEKGDIWY